MVHHRGIPGTRRNLRISLTALALLLGPAIALSAAPAPKDFTVGEFAMLMASRIQASGAPLAPSTPEEAAASLQRIGIHIKKGLSSPLTEADAVGLFEQFGISLRAQAPGNLLERDRAASLIGIFGANLASANRPLEMSLDTRVSGSTTATLSVETEPWWPFPNEPADCQVLWPEPTCTTQVCKNPCMYCCNKQLGQNGTLCGHLCQKKNLIVTPSEPNL